MKVRDIMNSRPVTVTPEESVEVAARLLGRHNIGMLPVCSDDGRLRGVVTDRDVVLRCVAGGDDAQITPVKEIMTRAVAVVSPEEDVSKAAEMMGRSQIRRLAVIDGGRLVGVVSLGDLARRPDLRMEAARALGDISSNVRRMG